MYNQIPNISLITPPDNIETNPDISSDQSQKKNDPEIQPQKGGNGYVIALSIVGIILGGTFGFFISIGFVHVFIVVLCTIGGVVIGGAVGAYLGEQLKKHAAELHRENKHS